MSRLKEDVAYGIYDRPIASKFDEQQDQESDRTPVALQPQMSVQLSVNKPPIEDEQYAPVSLVDLSHSAAEIARHVPPDQVRFFYKGLHKLLDKATDQTTSVDIPEESMKENALRKSISKVLLEIWTDEEKMELEKYRGSESSEEDGASDPDLETGAVPDESNLENLSSEFGFSGPSGVRQFINRTLSKMQFAAENLDDQAIASLNSYAVPEYIDTMLETGFIDPEDVKDLQASPLAVQGLPSYRYFFVSAFILPVYKQISRDSNREVRSGIDSLGVPKDLYDTVFNQATGRAAAGSRTIKAKLEPRVSSGEMTSSEASQIENDIRDFVQTSKAGSHPPSDEFVSQSIAKWQSLGRSKRKSVLEKALKSTIEDVNA